MYKRILAPYDGSHYSKLGLDEAVKLARDQKAALRIVHVVDELAVATFTGPMAISAQSIELLRELGQETLQDAVDAARSGGVAAEGALYEGLTVSVPDVILADAAKWGADLIVMGTHGRSGFLRMVVGSVAHAIVRASPVPVLLVRDHVAEARSASAKVRVAESVA